MKDRFLGRNGGRNGNASTVTWLSCSCLGISMTETLSNGSARAKQTDSHGGLRPTLFSSYFLNLEALQIVPLKDHTVIVFASFQNSPDINSGEIDFRGS